MSAPDLVPHEDDVADVNRVLIALASGAMNRLLASFALSERNCAVNRIRSRSQSRSVSSTQSPRRGVDTAQLCGGPFRSVRTEQHGSGAVLAMDFMSARANGETCDSDGYGSVRVRLVHVGLKQSR